MADKPISFSGPMVRALLEGRKTQTRRLFPARLRNVYVANDNRDSSKPDLLPGMRYWNVSGAVGGRIMLEPDFINLMPYAVGDRLYVREAWRVQRVFDEWAPVTSKRGGPILRRDQCALRFVADNPSDHWLGKYRQAMHMPRWASRMFLVVTDVRVQRLHDISTEDCMAEGIVQTWGDFGGEPPAWALASIEGHGDASGSHIYDNRTSRENYFVLLDHLHGDGFSAGNPLMVAYSFTVHRGNIDGA